MNTFIICPHCGFQYLPGEIYDPKHFLGQPKDIVRNSLGEILGHDGIVMDLEETYTCENCNKEMNIKAKVTFTVNADKKVISQNEPELKKLSLF